MVALKKLPVSKSNFKEIIESDYYYIDKSLFIKEIIDNGFAITLLPRPRRFGKTLNISMLQYFFEKPVLSNVEGTEKSNAHLFKNLAIAHHDDCMEHQGKYPVIALTFKEIKASSWQECYKDLKTLIAIEFGRHAYLLDGNSLSQTEKDWFVSVRDMSADTPFYRNALKTLSLYLYRHYGKKTIILIDEYDSPIHAGFTNNYYKEIIDFMRPFLGGGLKDNEAILCGVITGILRVSRECVLSDLNNLDVCTFFNKRYQNHFGLSESDVETITKTYNIKTPMDKIEHWYNGYTFGEQKIYNPWSIINFVQNDGKLQPFWARSSVNDVIKDLIQHSDCDLKSDIELLMQGKHVTKIINENIVFPELEKNTEMIWNFLLFTGYLTYKKYRQEKRVWIADLIIPNEEMMSLFDSVVLQWFSSAIVGHAYKKMLHALVIGDIAIFDDYFTDIVLKSFSNFDIADEENKEPEKFYHAFVLGLLVSLAETHVIKSNRESGYGRYDVMLIPLDKHSRGIVIEFKKVSHKRKETLESAVQKALDQLEEKKYETELQQMGITNITKIGIAFDGKKTLVKEG